MRRYVMAGSPWVSTPNKSITFVRHGRVLISPSTRIPADDFRAFVERYRISGVDSENAPPQRLCELAQSADVLACSDLPRAVESAQLLAPSRDAFRDALFREAGIPVKLPVPFHLRPTTWTFWARVLWFAGWNGDCESLVEARDRSRRAAARLRELASLHGTVVLVAHGIINSLMARELRRDGWRGPWTAARRHWGATRYVRAA